MGIYMIGDRHLHTCYSLDSDEPAENVILAAIQKGMKEICITDHRDFDFGPAWYLDLPAYFKGITELKEKYAEKIDVHIGVEVGLNPEYQKEMQDFLASYPFEYVIGSVHSVAGDDPYYRDRYDMDDRQFFKLYFDELLTRVSCAEGIDVVGHFDYTIRYGEYGSRYYDPADYADTIEEILKIIIRRGIALELNTAGLRKNAGFVHPHRYILDRFRDLGGKWISVGSDAHAAVHVGAGFEELLSIMKEYGFDESNLIPFRRGF